MDLRLRWVVDDCAETHPDVWSRRMLRQYLGGFGISGLLGHPGPLLALNGCNDNLLRQSQGSRWNPSFLNSSRGTAMGPMGKPAWKTHFQPLTIVRNQQQSLTTNVAQLWWLNEPIRGASILRLGQAPSYRAHRLILHMASLQLVTASRHIWSAHCGCFPWVVWGKPPKKKPWVRPEKGSSTIHHCWVSTNTTFPWKRIESISPL